MRTTAELRLWKTRKGHGKSWNFKSFKEYEPCTWGAYHSTKYSGNSGWGSEWNSLFPEFHSEILFVPRKVGLKFRKIGITGKFRSIRPFLLGPRSPSSEIELNMVASSFSCFYLTVLLDIIAVDWPQQTLVRSLKIHVRLRVMWACLSVFFQQHK